jgi:DNA polymerase III alpha subunit (gram-positive type)
MQFKNDILVLDFEGRGVDLLLQVGAILLDKKTLEEKANFCSYIHADLHGRESGRSGITQEMLIDAPSQKEVGEMLLEKFGTDVMLASWVANLDMAYLDILMKAAGLSLWKTYDYHVLDIWPAAYIYLVKQGYAGGLRSEEIFQYFGAKPRTFHDALGDCRIAADILRKIVS